MNDLLMVLLYATPLILAAAGDTVVQRSGLLNIGLEGQMLLAAFVGFLASHATGSPWLGLAAGAGAGLALAAVAGWFSIRLHADQVVVGTATTLLALGGTAFAYRSRFGQSGQIVSVPTLPKVAGVDAVMVAAVLLVPILGWLLFRTRWGLAARAASEKAEAAHAAEFSVARLRGQALAIGGALAGLAGAYLALGVAGGFAENMTQGRGFVAIAMVTFGRWKPHWVFLACLMIGWLESLQYTAQAKGWPVPFQLLLAAPYIVALLVLVFSGKGALAPAALGKPYRGTK